MIEKEAVLQALRGVIDPELGQNLVALNLIRHVDIQDAHIFIKMRLTTPFCPLATHLLQQVREHVSAIVGVEEVDVKLVWD